MSTQPPILRCALVPEERFKQILRFFYANNGHKLDPRDTVRLGGKAARRFDDEWETVTVVNVTVENIANQPKEVVQAVEREVMH